MKKNRNSKKRQRKAWDFVVPTEDVGELILGQQLEAEDDLVEPLAAGGSLGLGLLQSRDEDAATFEQDLGEVDAHPCCMLPAQARVRCRGANSPEVWLGM